MSTKHLLLAWIKKNPSHGYMIKKRYGEFINPSESLNDAKLYPLLRQMEDEGLITRRLEETDAGPARKTIEITPEGDALFEKWLESDEGETMEHRPRYDFFRAFPFLTKFSFFYELDRKQVALKLEQQKALHDKKLEDFTRARGKMIEMGLETTKIQAIEFGIMLEQTILEWIEGMRAYYGRGKKKD